MAECYHCASRFMDAEDYRDHLPCPVPPMTQREARLMAELRRLKSSNGVDWYALSAEIFDRIAHGDDAHRRWLKIELDRWAEARDGR